MIRGGDNFRWRKRRFVLPREYLIVKWVHSYHTTTICTCMQFVNIFQCTEFMDIQCRPLFYLYWYDIVFPRAPLWIELTWEQWMWTFVICVWYYPPKIRTWTTLIWWTRRPSCALSTSRPWPSTIVWASYRLLLNRHQVCDGLYLWRKVLGIFLFYFIL